MDIARTLAALALCCAPLAPAQSATNVASSPDGTLLQVSATGEVHRVPDVAQLGVGVVAESAEAKEALASNAKRMNEVVAAVRRAGIAERDVQTSGVSLQPQYRYVENAPPKLTGYQAHNRLSVKVRDVAKVGDVLDALVGVGANQVDGPIFMLDEPEAALDEARRDALAKAQARAAMYAKTLGLAVRRIVSVDETGSGFPPPPRPMAYAKAELAMDASSTPILPGEQAHSVTIHVVFELR